MKKALVGLAIMTGPLRRPLEFALETRKGDQMAVQQDRKPPLVELQTIAETWTSLRRQERRGQLLAISIIRKRKQLLQVVRFLLNVPIADISVSATAVGIDVRERLFEGRDQPMVYDRFLTHPVRFLRTAAFRRLAVGVLQVPEDLEVYGNRHTLRKGVRRANRDGVITREVTKPEEQIAVITEVLRLKSPGWGNEELKRSERRIIAGVSRTFIATSDDGIPLAVTIASIDTTWAYLRMSVSTNDSRASAARHALHMCVVRALADYGCRFCFTDCVLYMPPGLRELQYLLGFAPRHLRLR